MRQPQREPATTKTSRRRHQAVAWRPFVMACALVGVLGMAGPAAAHDRWVQPYAPVVRAGQVAYFDLMLGNHSKEHRSYRLAGKPGREGLVVTVTDPAGRQTSLNEVLFDTGEADDTPPPGPKGYLSGSFIPESPGIYIISAAADAVLQHGDEPAFRSLSLAKTVVAATGTNPATVKGLHGYDRSITEDRLEIIPLANPAAVTPGDEIAFKIVLKGQPLAGQKVAVIRRSTSTFEEYETDQQGVIRFKAGEPDYYMIRLEYDNPQEQKPGEYAKTTYEATFTYIVQPGVPETQPGNLAGRIPAWGWLVAGGVLGVAGTALGGLGRRR